MILIWSPIYYFRQRNKNSTGRHLTVVSNYHIITIDRRTLLCTRNEPIILITAVMFLLKEVHYLYPCLYFKSRHCSKPLLPYLMISTFGGIRVYLQKTIHICRVNPYLSKGHLWRHGSQVPVQCNLPAMIYLHPRT